MGYGGAAFTKKAKGKLTAAQVRCTSCPYNISTGNYMDGDFGLSVMLVLSGELYPSIVRYSSLTDREETSAFRVMIARGLKRLREGKNRW